jgi:hypothetical protein
MVQATDTEVIDITKSDFYTTDIEARHHLSGAPRKTQQQPWNHPTSKGSPMKNQISIALLLLTGCASTGNDIANSIAAVTKPLLTIDTPTETEEAVEPKAETAENYEPTEAECSKKTISISPSDTYIQQLCAQRANKKLAEENKDIIQAAKVRNPPQITRLGQATAEEGTTKVVRNDENALKVSRIIDRYAQLDTTGFSLDYVPMGSSETFMMEFRLVNDPKCNGYPGMEQMVWTDIKTGQPELGKVHCFAEGKTTFVNMSQGAFSTGNEARVFSIEGQIKNGEPWVRVFQSNIHRIY